MDWKSNQYCLGAKSLNDDELNDIRQLIDHMQSGLVELFNQLRELRERLHLITGLPEDSTPSIMPLFSEVKPKQEYMDELSPVLEPEVDEDPEQTPTMKLILSLIPMNQALQMPK